MDLTNLKEYLNSVDPSCSEVKVGIEIIQKPCGESSPNEPSGTAGTSGTSGISGTSGKDGIGLSGTSGTTGTIFVVSSGTNSVSGTSGTSGITPVATSGTSGKDGSSGVSGTSGTNGTIFVYTEGGGGGAGYNQVATQEQFKAAVKSQSGQYTLLPNNFIIDENITLAKDVKLVFLQGAQITINQGTTFTVEGRIDADDYYKIWNVQGILDLSPRSMSYASVCHFGAVPDGTTDSTAAFKATVKAAQRLTVVKIPQSAANTPYIISDTIEFHTYLYPGFYGWKVFGEKTDMNGYYMTGTNIKYTAKSKPCFNFKGQRLSHIYSFSIEGVNQAPEQLVHGNQIHDTKVWDRKNWVSEGVQLEGPDHLSGIAIDWNANNDPNIRCSAQMYIFDVQISKVVVGLSISPLNGLQQADTIDTLKLKVEKSVYGISVAQDQIRSCTFTNSWMDANFATHTNMAYGEGRGSCFNIFGGQYTTNFKLFECTAAARGNCSINGMFCEANGIIGSWHGLGCNVNSVVFTGCEFGLDDNAWEKDEWGSWVTPVTTMEAGTNIVFNGCTFNSRKKMLGFSGNTYTFIGTSFCQTRKVYFMTPPTVIGTNGPHNCSGDWKDWSDNIMINYSTQRKQVLPTVKTAYLKMSLPQGTVNLKNYVGDWYGVAYAEMPKTKEKYFNWTVSEGEAKQFMVGDYINGYADATLSGLSIYGLGLGWGQSQIPAFEVIEKNGTTLKLRRTGPEVVTSYPNESKYGNVWIGMDTFYINDHPQTLAEGTTVEVKNTNLLQVGDVVSINGTLTRILAIVDKMVTFSQHVPVGKLKSISHE